MHFSILIAFKYSNSDSLRKLNDCLLSIYKSISELGALDVEVTVIIVDDHSEYDCKNLLQKHKNFRLKWLINELPQGQGNALNYALTQVNSDYYLFTDSDCIVDEDWIVNTYKYLLNSEADCVVGPNWFHQDIGNIWAKYLTSNESKLMEYIFKTYLYKNEKYSGRIDCRNLCISKKGLNKLDGHSFFSNVIYGNSSNTSYSLRKIEDFNVEYYNGMIVFHEPIRSLLNHLIKYYKRGKYGKFFKIYSNEHGGLFKSFLRKYMKRHFLLPYINNNVSIPFLLSVHGAFWSGIMSHND